MPTLSEIPASRFTPFELPMGRNWVSAERFVKLTVRLSKVSSDALHAEWNIKTFPRRQSLS